MVEALFQISEPGESRPKAACKGRAAGIDLGTTNSLIAVVHAGQPVCLDAEGGPGEGADAVDVIVPSAVYFAADGGTVVGKVARDELSLRHPEDTILSVKRFMGRGIKDVGVVSDLTPYRFAPATADEQVVRMSVAGGQRVVTPVEVSAEILKVLRARAELALGGELDGVVITVPAYFDDGQRQATRDAGRLAGLEVMRLLNEPTAAALAYGLDKKRDGIFAVFDLGGGTFDISILKLAAGVFEVKSTGGDSALGGDDFDRAIGDLLIARMGTTMTIERSRAARPVLASARAAKERLTEREAIDVVIELPGLAPFSTMLTRSAMEAVVRPVLDRCTGPVRRALRDAGVVARDLDGVILVGGATRMPLVRRQVAVWFEREPLSDLDPERVVALGAAIQADILAGGDNPDDLVLLDVVPLSLGLEMMGGVAERLIHRNSTVPCGATQTFTTYADNQTGFDLHVVQGEREMVTECRSLARFKLGGIPPAPAGMARLDVTFTVDADGILSVAARETMTGKEATIQVKPSYGLAEGEVERMLLDSFAHAESDVKARLLTERRVEADRILNATRAAMKATPALLLASEPAAIERAITVLEAAKRGTDATAIRDAITALDASSKDFAARRMNAALEQGIAGRSVAVVENEIGTHAIKGHHSHDHG